VAKVYSARKAGEKLGLTHLEVIRRIRRGDIRARKLDWNWIVTDEAIEEVKQAEWYIRRQARAAREASASSAS